MEEEHEFIKQLDIDMRGILKEIDLSLLQCIHLIGIQTARYFIKNNISAIKVINDLLIGVDNKEVEASTLLFVKIINRYINYINGDKNANTKKDDFH